MKKEGEKNKRAFFTRPLGIGILIIVGFIIGNVWGVTGRINLLSVGSISEFGSVPGLPDNLDYSSVEVVYDKLRGNYDGKLTEEQLITGLKKGMAEATGDPYTEYFTAKEASDFESSINGSFTGIGAELGKDADGNIIVVAPIADNPAEKAGIKPQDIIASIDGTTTSGMSIEEAVKKIRGEKGTSVKLRIIRNKAEALEFTIVRDNIQIKSVKHEILEGSNFGLIEVSTFGNDTPELIRAAAIDLKSKNVKGVILDLRGNPGGILDSAVSVSNEWLPEGKKILEEKRGAVVLKTYKSTGPGTLAGIPTVVLINEGSASASEITAGALKDNNAAYLIGEKSYGKGVVQQPICIGGGGVFGSKGCDSDMLKVTVASWYRPNGQNINNKGIQPDQKVSISEADAEAERDPQKDAAISYLSKR